MIPRLLQILLSVSLLARTTAAEVELSALGSLELAFANPVAVELYPGQPVAAQVAFRQGDAFTLVAPGRVQQIEYLVETGAWMDKGQAFAVLRGPEMHHFQIEYESSRTLLEASRRRYESNKALYQRKAIRESQWIEISENYYRAQLEYEHLRHFYQWVAPDAVDADPDALTLTAPFAGLVSYAIEHGAVEVGGTIAKFVPREAIRLEVTLPNAMRGQIAYLQAEDCRLSVERIGGITSGFFVTAWTAPLQPGCGLIPGQKLLATPLLRTAAVRLPMAAVFQWNGGSHVMVRDGGSLRTVAVTLLGSEGGDYVLRGDSPLAGREVLVSSVSAVQGVLLGLGGE